MMSLTFGLFTQVSGSGPLGPLVIWSRGVKFASKAPGDDLLKAISCDHQVTYAWISK